MTQAKNETLGRVPTVVYSLCLCASLAGAGVPALLVPC